AARAAAGAESSPAGAGKHGRDRDVWRGPTAASAAAGPRAGRERQTGASTRTRAAAGGAAAAARRLHAHPDHAPAFRCAGLVRAVLLDPALLAVLHPLAPGTHDARVDDARDSGEPLAALLHGPQHQPVPG